MSKATIDLQGNELLVIKSASRDITKDEGAPIVRLISTNTFDHDEDIVHQGKNASGQGWILAAYNRNPKIFFSHQTKKMPLGGGEAFLAEHPKFGLSLHHRDEFDMADPEAALLEGKVRRGFIVESSVGFIGVKTKPIDGSAYGREFFEQRLLEATYCNWGANSDTAVMAKEFLTRHPGVALKVETGDSAAAYQQQKEVADALADIKVRLKTLEDIASAMAVQREVDPVFAGLAKRLADAGLIQ